MASFVGRLQNILVSKLSAVVLISLLLSCLSIFPIANASAQPCNPIWDISVTSGMKTNYQSGETISGNISFRLNNPTDCPSCIQQILIGIIDLQNKVIDVKCVYDGAPKVCPAWTTGTASFSLKAPATPGNYKIIAANDYQYSCSDAINRFPSLCSSTSPYCKDITTITISAAPPPPTPPGQPDTGKKNGTVGVPDTTKPSGGIAPIALNKNTIIIISFVAALVILTLFASRKKGSKRYIKSILLLVFISFIGYLFWVYAIPLIADWFRHNLGTLIKVLLALVALAVIGVVVWRYRKGSANFSHWLEGVVKQPPSPPRDMSCEQFRKYIMNMHWRNFELYIGNLLKKLNFQDVIVTQASIDHGIDVKANRKDELGIKSDYIIQCKLYQNSRVGEPDITRLFGNMQSTIPHPKGIVVSPSGFTKAAQDFAQRCGIALWDIDFLYELYKKSL